MHPDSEANESGRHHRYDNGGVSENAAARETRHESRKNCGPRQEDDVDFRMSKEPEEVLVEKNISTFCGIEEVRTHEPIEKQQPASHHHGRHCKTDHH